MVYGIDCRECSRQRKRIMGCEADAPQPYTIEGQEYRRCPMRETGEKEITWIHAYLEYQRGKDPEPGGWLDQPIKYAIVMRIIENAIERMRKAKDGRPEY